MSSDHTDHRSDPERSSAVGDVHDIRALTATGAIVLPHRHASKTGDAARAKRTAL